MYYMYTYNKHAPSKNSKRNAILFLKQNRDMLHSFIAEKI